MTNEAESMSFAGGELSEWPKEPDSKSGRGASSSRVRIPCSPLEFLNLFRCDTALGGGSAPLIDSPASARHNRWVIRKHATKAFIRTVYESVRARRALHGPLRPSWDARFETLAFVLHHYAKRSTRIPLKWQRKALELNARKTSVVKSMRFEPVSIDGVHAEWFTPPGEVPSDRALIYFHGGGYSVGSIRSHRDVISRLAVAAGVRTLVPEYRLAPEHPFPAQLEDARAVYRWVRNLGIAANRIVLAGESAGGGLTLSTLVASRDAGEPLPAAAVLWSPWLDLEANSASMDANAPFDYVSRDVLRTYAQRFVGAHDLRNPLAAPIHAELHNLPPLLVQAGGAETLLDDSVRVHARAKEAGVDITLEIDDDMIHAWHVFAPRFVGAQKAIDRAGAFVKRHLR